MASISLNLLDPEMRLTLIQIYVPIIMISGIIGNGLGLWTDYRQSLVGRKNVTNNTTLILKRKKTVNSIVMQLIFLVNLINCLSIVLLPLVFNLKIYKSYSEYLRERNMAKNVVPTNGTLNHVIYDKILLDFRSGLGLKSHDHSIYPFDVPLNYKGCRRFFSGSINFQTKKLMRLIQYAYLPAANLMITFSLYLSVIFIIDQCIALAYPHKYRSWSNPKVIWSVIIGCFLFSIIWSFSLTSIVRMQTQEFSFIPVLVERLYFAKQNAKHVTKHTFKVLSQQQKNCEVWYSNRSLKSYEPKDQLRAFNKTTQNIHLKYKEISQKNPLVIYVQVCEIFSRILPFALAVSLKIIVIYKLKSLHFSGITHSKLFTPNFAKNFEYAQLGIEPMDSNTTKTSNDEAVENKSTQCRQQKNYVKSDVVPIKKENFPTKPTSQGLKESSLNNILQKTNDVKENSIPIVNSARLQRLTNETKKNTIFLIIFIVEFFVLLLPISIFYLALPFFIYISDGLNFYRTWVFLYLTEFLYISSTFYFNFAFNNIFRQNVIKACSKQNTSQISPSLN